MISFNPPSYPQNPILQVKKQTRKSFFQILIHMISEMEYEPRSYHSKVVHLSSPVLVSSSLKWEQWLQETVFHLLLKNLMTITWQARLSDMHGESTLDAV